MEYHEIGERFEYDGVTLEVVEYNEYAEGDVIPPCYMCFFNNKCTKFPTYCSPSDRKDGEYAYYKLVKQCKTDYTCGNTNSKAKLLGGLTHLVREEERKEWGKLPLEAKCNKTKDMEMDLEFYGIDYHDIGERFDHYGVTLEVKENTEKDKRKSCDLCYIQRMCSEIKHSPKPPIRNCSPFSRKDRKSVYYVHVEEDYEHKTEQVETKDMEKRRGDNEGVSGYEALPKKERVNHPDYYNRHPSGVECITIIRHHNFNIGSVIKYCWRNGLKTEAGISDKDKQIEDLKKAIFYLNDEIKRLEEF